MTTTNSVTFSVDDVELLYSIPKPGGDLTTIVRAFVFLNRCAAPSFLALRGCFTKALQSGIVVEDGGQFQIAQVWYERIHAHDDSIGNEIDAMLAFQDDFLGEEVPVLNAARFVVTEEEYDELVREVQL